MSLRTRVTNRDKGNFIISLEGSLDNDTYNDFKKVVEATLKNPVTVLVLDLSGLEYISTLGVGALLKTKQSVEETEGNFSIINVQPQVQKIFNLIIYIIIKM